MENFDNFIKNHTAWLDNPYVSGMLTVFLVVYASMAAPKLPSYIAKLFDNTFFKLFIFFLIVFVSKRNATVALVAAVALMVSIMALERIKVGEEMMAVTGGKHKLKMNGCVCECDEASDMPENHIVKTEEGHMVLHEAKKLEADHELGHVHVMAVVDHIAHAEKNGHPVLVAHTEEGAKHMQEVAKAEHNGTVTETEAKKMVAKIVVHEIVKNMADMHNEHDMLPHTDLKSEIHASADHSSHTVSESTMSPATHVDKLVHPSHLVSHHNKKTARAEREMVKHEQTTDKASMAVLAREVLKRKQEETVRRGVEPSNEELKRICAGVLSEHRHTPSCGGDCGKKDHGNMVIANDENASSYGSV